MVLVTELLRNCDGDGDGGGDDADDDDDDDDPNPIVLSLIRGWSKSIHDNSSSTLIQNHGHVWRIPQISNKLLPKGVR